MIVSVPLRGNGYRKLQCPRNSQNISIKLVSVPLRGNGYRKLSASTPLAAATLFPSPCGVMVIGNHPLVTTTKPSTRMFPSPCGVMVIGNRSRYSRLVRSCSIGFPSPCGVMVIGNYINKVSTLFFGKVSVPLRGNGYRK